jgi:hypothetical protein
MESFAVDAEETVLRMNSKSTSKGNGIKLCKRHSQKRSLEFDDWEYFIMLLRNWNKLVSDVEL